MRAPLEVADVFRDGEAHFLAEYGHTLSREQRQVLRAVIRCRTAQLGGHVQKCDDCGHQRIQYNSCRNRHCPKCQAMARAAWLEKRESELLPVGYFHVVFTLPHELGPLALQNKRVVYGLLFRAAAQTLLEIAADPKHLGAKIGCLMVLHSWGQNLMHHPHVHAIVTGGGLSPDGSRWIHGKQSKRRKPFFAPGKVLSRVFRGKFIDMLKRAFRSGELGFYGRLKSLGDLAAFEQLLSKAAGHDWVVYAKRPFSSPACVLKYLARYTHRVAISNRRLVELQNGRVSFRYKDYSDGQQSKVLPLSSSEFIRRFLMHTLPSGFVRIRYYGFLANRHRNERLEKCRRLLGVTSTPTSTTEESQTPVENSDSSPSPKTCPACGLQSLVIIDVVPATRPLPLRRPYFLTDRTVDSNCFDTS
ncbi:MAG: IS91 family transposase [Planctomycetaceae bacterium]